MCGASCRADAIRASYNQRWKWRRHEGRIRRKFALALLAVAVVVIGTEAAASAASFPGRQVGTSQPCDVGAAKNGQGAKFEERGGGVCWVTLP